MRQRIGISAELYLRASQEKSKMIPPAVRSFAETSHAKELYQMWFRTEQSAWSG